MASLTSNLETFEKPGLVVSYKQSAAVIFKGALVGVNASGYLAGMSHAAASLKFVGVANEKIDNSAGAAGDKSLNVTKSGSFFSYGDERLGQGRNNAKAFLDEHPEMAKEIEGKVYAALGLDRDLVVPIERDADRSLPPEEMPDVPGVDAVEQAAA